MLPSLEIRQSLDGGGMYNQFNSSPTLTNVSFNGNLANDDGGGMFNNGGCSPTLTNVAFRGNSSSGFGGGMYNVYNSSILTNVTFSENLSGLDGGGMFNHNSNSSLTNVTFSGNSAHNGGGLYNTNSSSPTLTNVTISGNIAVDSGGGMHNSYSNPTITNTIVWGNKPDQIYNNGSSPSIRYSDIQGGYTGTGNLNVNPLWDSLANNGGFTQTHALGAGSPAIDTGNPNNCPSTDQRSFHRPIDGNGDGTAACDMGAYEYASYPTLFSLTISIDGSGSVNINPDKLVYKSGEEVSLTASANPRWTFVGWTGDVTSIDNPLALTITGNTSITANFIDTFYIYLPLILKN